MTTMMRCIIYSFAQRKHTLDKGFEKSLKASPLKQDLPEGSPISPLRGGDFLRAISLGRKHRRKVYRTGENGKIRFVSCGAFDFVLISVARRRWVSDLEGLPLLFHNASEVYRALFRKGTSQLLHAFFFFSLFLFIVIEFQKTFTFYDSCNHHKHYLKIELIPFFFFCLMGKKK